MTVDELTGEVAFVSISDRVLTLAPLSIEEERALFKQWEALAKADSDKRTREAYHVAALAPTHELAAIAVHRIIDNTQKGVKLPFDVVLQYRETPAGVRAEVFARTRKTHPEIEREELDVLINEANYIAISREMDKAISGNVGAP